MNINSIFSSINGEVSHCGQGSLCTFIRVQGCNLRCSYCDTIHAQETRLGTEMTINDIVKVVKSLNSRNITITGGEPLFQRVDLIKLTKALKKKDPKYRISVETNGSISIPHSIDSIDCWIADWKTISSGMGGKMQYSHFENLMDYDFVKFVIKDRFDFEDALNFIVKTNAPFNPRYAFSPMYNVMPADILVDWMQSSSICMQANAILNMQLHKIISVA